MPYMYTEISSSLSIVHTVVSNGGIFSVFVFDRINNNESVYTAVDSV